MREAFTEGQQPEIARNTEGELPEVKIFDLLSSVGNGENKALELIVMREGVIYSRNALYHEVMNHQAKDNRWKMGEPLPFDHCQYTLSPIGLVTKEALSPDGTAWGHEITQYGLRTGVPFAGLLLKWSYEHPDFSLYNMFGSTQSKSIRDEQSFDKKRAQETRYKIFWEIVTNPNNRIRLIDIANVINEEPILTGDHLRSLKENRVLSYEGPERGKSFSHFKKLKETIPSEEPEPYQTHKALTGTPYNKTSFSKNLR